jgi:exodeoxyribonuclease VII large subunit
MLVSDGAARAREHRLLSTRLQRAMGHRLTLARAELERRSAALGSPERLLAEPQQQLDEAALRIERALQRLLSERRAELGRLDRRLGARHPHAVIAGARAALGPLSMRLGAAARRHLAALRRSFVADVARLEALSPLRVLARGYAIATDEGGRALVDAREVKVGDRIDVRVHQGALRATVTATAGPGEPLGGPPSGGGSPGPSRKGRPPRRRPPRAAGEQLGLGLDLRPEERCAHG